MRARDPSGDAKFDFENESRCDIIVSKARLVALPKRPSHRAILPHSRRDLSYNRTIDLSRFALSFARRSCVNSPDHVLIEETGWLKLTS